MSEIEKLYENAGCKKVFDCSECYKPCDNDICNFDSESKFASFKAEKQLELIKWLANKFSFFAIECDSKEWSSSNGLISGYYKKSLEESIADYINSLWQNLTEEEKQQVKEILE